MFFAGRMPVPKGIAWIGLLSVEEPDLPDGSEPVESQVEEQQAGIEIRQAVAPYP